MFQDGLHKAMLLASSMCCRMEQAYAGQRLADYTWPRCLVNSGL